MSDQGHWFKLWISALHDPDLGNLSLEDFARWAILGAYIKAHGTEGKILLAEPARALCTLFRVPDFAALRAAFQRLPNVCEEMQKCNGAPETILSVSMRNWLKYQGDYSTLRVRKFREMKRSKRRGEEKRGEEKKKRVSPSVLPLTSNGSNGHSEAPPFIIAASIVSALDKCARLGAEAKLRDPQWWRAEIRANPGVDIPRELLRSEAYLASHPEKHYKRLPVFLHGWLGRADREGS